MPGDIRKNSISSDGDADMSHLAHQAVQFIRLCYRWQEASHASTQLLSVSIYPPSPKRNGDWLVVGKGFSGGYRLVAFHRSAHPLKALLGFFQKCADQTLDWKQDDYAQTNREWLGR